MEKKRVLDPIMNTKLYKDYLRMIMKGREDSIKKVVKLSKLKQQEYMEKKEYYIKGDFFYCKKCDSRLGFPMYGNTICDKCSRERKDGLLVGKTITIEDQKKLKTDIGGWKAYSKEPLLYSQKEVDELIDKAREEGRREMVMELRDIYWSEKGMEDFGQVLEDKLSKLKE